VIGIGAALALALAAALLPRAIAGQGAREALNLVPGELLVQYREQVRPAGARLLEQSMGALALQTAGPGGRLARLEVPIGQEAAVAGRLRATPGVDFVQPNYLYHVTRTPTDPLYTSGQQWDLDRIGGPSAWDRSIGSRNVVVAVLDTGIDYKHPDLAPNMWTNPAEANGRARVDDDNDGVIDDIHGFNAVANTGDPFDDFGHGTHVSGTIGAVADGAGAVGVNWQVSLMACKFLDATGNGTTVDAVRCIDYIDEMFDRGVNVVAINASWGGTGADLALQSAIARAGTRGILTVCAAGNGDALGRGIDNDGATQRNYPASYPDSSIIAVTATDSSDLKAPWANYGAQSVDIGAPGVAILSTFPGAAYRTLSGTSMATPHVTGAVALLKAYNPALTGAQVKNLILQSADSVPGLQGLCVSGGRLNIARALALAAPPASTPPAAPTGLAVAGVTANQVSLTWKDNAPNEDGYLLLRADDGSANYAQVASLPANSQSGADNSVLPGHTYAYVVQAYNTAGSTTAGPVTVTTPSPPAAPSGLHATSVTASRVDLAWQINSSDDAGFNVYRAEGASAYTRIGGAAAGVASYSDTGLVGGVTYNYYVEAFNSNGSAASSPISVTTRGNPATSIHVGSLSLTVQQNSSFGRLASRAFVTVVIRNAANRVVPGARVTGRFSSAATNAAAGTTPASGSVAFHTPWRNQPRGAVYTFTVANVAKSGCVYHPEQNALTSVSGTVKR
jgi:subtilisin family serine protease